MVANRFRSCCFLSILWLLLSTGCSSLIRGKEETVEFKTDPSGVSVTLSNGQSCLAPCEMAVKRGLALNATFEKEGYESKSAIMASKVSGGAVVMSLFGTIVGVIIDSIGDSWMSYNPNPIMVSLLKKSPDQVANNKSKQNIENNISFGSELTINIPQGTRAGKYDVAVVIGNRDYQSQGVPAVDYALNDAKVMRSHLMKTFGYESDNILYIENASYAAMNQMFGSERDPQGKLFNFVKPGESRIFIYYVGHGAPDLDTGEAYFVPVDADPQYLKNSGYRLRTFFDNIAKLPAKDVTIVLDSCFSGGSQNGFLFKDISPAMLKVEKEAVGLKNALVFTSGRNDQVSTWYPEKEHSLFTYFFIKGLQGDADHDGNRTLTVSEMDAYLTENVPYMARRLSGREQTPIVNGGRNNVLVVLN